MSRDDSVTLTPGQRLSHYEIIEEVGVGGHGVVYRAKNVHLDKVVAVKVLAPWVFADKKMAARLRREARTLSTLDHPNVATVHDLDSVAGTDFLVMEYLPGNTLAAMLEAGPIPEPKLLKLALQIGEGLAAAHAEDIVHRDLKPGNLKADREGRLKILDFGLARQAPRGDRPGDETLTESQVIVGTLPYMAPEQLLGKEADPRTDIYAFGCVLYEMATGSKLFPKVSSEELRGAILYRKPHAVRRVNPRVSMALERVIHRALEKDPARRFQSVRELMSALEPIGEASGAVGSTGHRWTRKRALTSAGVLGAALVAIWILLPPPPRLASSLAVLPFEDISGDPEIVPFADEMHQELITNIGRVGGDSLRVIARGSVMPYKGKHMSLQEIGRQLKVDALVEGTVARHANKVRVSVQLADARSGLQLWGDSYQREVDEVFPLQSEIARAIARKVLGSLTASQKSRATQRKQVDPAATDAYLEGRLLWNERTESGIRRALQRFERAAEIDPEFAEAYAGIADAYGSLAMQDALPVQEAYPRVKESALKALELDNGIPEAHASLGNFLQNFQWDWPGAEERYRRAIALNPSYPIAHQWLALMLAQRGEFAPAIEEALVARELDHSPPIVMTVAACYYYARRYDEAIEQCLEAMRMEATHPTGYRVLAGAYVQKGMDAEAFEVLEESVRAAGDSAQAAALHGIYDVAGPPGVARAMVIGLIARRETELVAAVRIAELFAYLGAADEALDWLAVAYEGREVGLNRLKVDPIFDGLRAEPRFVELLEKLERNGMFQGRTPGAPANEVTAWGGPGTRGGRSHTGALVLSRF